MHDWSPEVVVNEALARQLVATQFPDLRIASMRPLDEGYDNTVFLANGSTVFRFPRREVAVAGLRREIEILPVLGPMLPLAVPRPTYVGAPSAEFPWPFFGAPMIPGRELAHVTLSDGEAAHLAERLGTFLATLHAPKVLEEIDPGQRLPVDPMGRGDMGRRVPRTIDALSEVTRHGLWDAPDRVSDIVHGAQGLSVPSADALTHGDLHLRHILIDGGRASGVIDWVDVGRANRCVDLVLYWSALTPPARERFSHVYGPFDDETLLRARVLSFYLCAVLVTYADATGKPELLAELIRGLARTATD